MGTRKVRIYPDTPEYITALIGATSMRVAHVYEVEEAYIIVSTKPSDRQND